MQEEWFEANRQGWNLRTPVHRTSEFYDVAGWQNGKSSPYPCFRKGVLGSDGLYRIQGLEDKIPLLYSLRMSKP